GLSLSRAFQRYRRGLTSSAAVAVFLVAWEVVGSQGIVSAELISYPSQIVQAAVAMAASGELAANSLVTLVEFVEGFVPAVAVGLIIGLLLAMFRRLRYLCDPVLMALYTAPRIAMIPIVVIWFGIDEKSKVVIVFLSAVFPVLMNTMAGVQQVDPVWIKAARAFGATRRQITQKIVLPGALPAIMAGIRLGVGRGLLSVIVAEMYVSLAGLGHMLQTLTNNPGDTAQIFVIALGVAAVGFFVVVGLRALEEKSAAWRVDLRS
ncbi:MAG: ABC transporter permease, partial [Chloroflexota bacterium]|nr:ABC transporter permease [Chloroflexota bacterium]